VGSSPDARSKATVVLVDCDAERDDVVTVRTRSLGDVAQRLDTEISDLSGVVFDFAGSGKC